MSRLLILLAALMAFAASAEEKGYRVVHPDGTVEFSDQPQPGAKEIPLPESQGYQAPSLPVIDSGSSSTGRKAAPAAYRKLEITSPQPDQTFQAAEGPVSVQVSVTPALQPGDKVVILLDGKEVASGTSAALANVERGTHTVTAEVRNAGGKVLIAATPVTFHLKQFSQLFKKAAP